MALEDEYDENFMDALEEKDAFANVRKY